MRCAYHPDYFVTLPPTHPFPMAKYPLLLETLRREGLLEARVALDAAARARVDAQSHRLRELIRRFFKLPDAPDVADVRPAPNRPGNGVAGGPPAP